jgi:hypothetical protein
MSGGVDEPQRPIVVPKLQTGPARSQSITINASLRRLNKPDSIGDVGVLPEE